jgi:hypothetical protein
MMFAPLLRFDKRATWPPVPRKTRLSKFARGALGFAALQRFDRKAGKEGQGSALDPLGP